MQFINKIDQPIDLEKIKLPKSPNYFITAAANQLTTIAHHPAPICAFNTEELQQRVASIMQQMPRCQLLYADAEQSYQMFRVRSKLCRFPDYVHIWFIEIEQDKSSLIIFSAAKYGYSDMDVNKRRVLHILDKITV